MAIIRWEPMRLGPWWRWPRIFDEDWDWPEEIGKGLNVYETKDSVVVEAAVPGVPTDKVEVEVEGDLITIRGRVEEEEKEEKKKDLLPQDGKTLLQLCDHHPATRQSRKGQSRGQRRNGRCYPSQSRRGQEEERESRGQG